MNPPGRGGSGGHQPWSTLTDFIPPCPTQSVTLQRSMTTFRPRLRPCRATFMHACREPRVSWFTTHHLEPGAAWQSTAMMEQLMVDGLDMCKDAWLMMDWCLIHAWLMGFLFMVGWCFVNDELRVHYWLTRDMNGWSNQHCCRNITTHISAQD